MFLRLLKAEFKILLKKIPVFLIGLGVLGLVCTGFAVFASEYIYSGDSGKIKIALYYPDEETSSLMIGAIEKMESAKESLEIIRAEEDEVKEMVEKGEAYGGIIIPPNFVNDIIYGKNTPATVYLPKGGTIDTLLVRSYLAAGIGDLAAAQAGIYAFLDCLGEEAGSSDIIDINLVYLNAAFSRESAFKDFTVSASGSLTLLQHYCLYGFIMFLLLFGITLRETGFSPSGALAEKLRVRGIGPFKLYFVNLIPAFLFYSVISWAAVGLSLLLPESSGLKPDLSPASVLGIFSAASFCAVFVSGIFYITDFSGVLIILFFTLVCGLLSGSVIPLSFLPESINTLSEFMPVKIMGSCLSPLYDPSAEPSGLYLPFIGAAVVFVIIYFKDMVK